MTMEFFVSFLMSFDFGSTFKILVFKVYGIFFEGVLGDFFTTVISLDFDSALTSLILIGSYFDSELIYLDFGLS